MEILNEYDKQRRMLFNLFALQVVMHGLDLLLTFIGLVWFNKEETNYIAANSLKNDPITLFTHLAIIKFAGAMLIIINLHLYQYIMRVSKLGPRYYYPINLMMFWAVLLLIYVNIGIVLLILYGIEILPDWNGALNWKA